MTLRINHNTAAINSWRNLKKTDAALSKTLERLSSGEKLNRAADGPANLVIAEQMRAQVKSLEQAANNSEMSISMVQTAEASLNEVNNILVSMRQLSLHAANEGANDDKMLAADQSEIQHSISTLDGIAKQAQFGSRNLLNGSNGVSGVAVGEGVRFVKAEPVSQSSPADGYVIDITEAATRARMVGNRTLSQDEIDAGNVQFTLHEGGSSLTYFSKVGETMDSIIKNIEQMISQNNLNVEIGLTEDGRLFAEHKEYGSDPTFGVVISADGLLSEEANVLEEAIQGLDVQGTIGGELSYGAGQYLTGAKGTRADGVTIQYSGGLKTEPQVDENGDPIYVDDFENDNQAIGVPEVDENGNMVLDADGEIVMDTSNIPAPPVDTAEGSVYVSNNSLTFQIGPNMGHTVAIDLPNVNTYTLSRGIDNESGFMALGDIDVTTFQGSQDALKLIDQAIYEISAARGRLGAFQKNTLETNLNNLRYATENMVSAESVIRDTDMAAEMSNFTKQQILLSSGMAMLGQANQTPKSVLSLLNAKG
ncbi:MAG: flagellin [Proteobacteria bacterium]|nr:flagellin [Pseudomonadota bacterium]